MLKQFNGCTIGTATQNALYVAIDRGVWSQFSVGGVGLTIDGLAVDTHARDLVINSTNPPPAAVNQPFAGIRIRSASGWIMSNCEVLAVQYGLLVDPTAGKRVEFGTFTACQFDSCGYDCMHIFPQGGTAYSLSFVNCWASAALEASCCLVGGNTNGVELVGHRFFAAANGNGLFVQAPAVNVHVDASVASGIGNAGFYFGPGVTKFAVRNSHSGPYGGVAGIVFPPSNYGVFVDSNCSNYIVANNTLSGNTVQGFFDGGLASPKIVSPNLT
jgi:hypothetical protein